MGAIDTPADWTVQTYKLQNLGEITKRRRLRDVFTCSRVWHVQGNPL
jgi:hypothetical protein